MEVQSGVFRDETPRFQNTEDSFVIRVNVKPLAWLDKDKAIPIREDIVWNNLSLQKDFQKPAHVGLAPSAQALIN